MSFSSVGFDSNAFSPDAFQITAPGGIEASFSDASFSRDGFSEFAFSFGTAVEPETPTTDRELIFGYGAANLGTRRERETEAERAERMRKARVYFGLEEEPVVEASPAEPARKRLAKVAPQVVIPEIPERFEIDLAELRLTPEELAQIRLEYREEYSRIALALILMASV